MPKLDKNNPQLTKELTKYTHDSYITRIEYNVEDGILKIEMDYAYERRVKTKVTFIGIDVFLSVAGDWGGNPKEVNILLLEDDLSFLEKYLPNHLSGLEDSFYIVIEVFSGGLMHIVAREVIIELDDEQ